MDFSSHSQITQFITPLDFVVFFGCLALTVASILYGHSLKNKDHNPVLEHLVMGRTLTLPLFVATLVATWYGGIFGVTEIAFNHGIYNFITQGVFWYLTYVIFALLMVDRVAAYKSVTLPELVSNMFGHRAGRVAAIFNFFNVLPVAYALSLGLFLQILTGWSLMTSTFVGTGVVCIYSMIGGMRSDVFSDAVQFFVMCTAVFCVVLFSYLQFGGYSFLQAKLPPTHFEPLGGHSLATTLVWGFIAMATLVDPNFYQRCFALDNTRSAKIGILVCTVVWCLFDMCTTLGAMYARAVIPDASAKQSYLIYAMQVLPSGLRGLFLAGIVAIIISTLDSFMLIAAQSISYDLLPRRWRNNIWMHRVSTICVALFAICLSFVFEGSVKTIWKTLGSYSAGCLLLPMLMGFFRPGVISEKAFIVATVLGAIGITVWRNMERQGIWANVDELYVGLVLTCVGMIVVTVTQKLASARES